jgi:hypothetical protein
VNFQDIIPILNWTESHGLSLFVVVSGFVLFFPVLRMYTKQLEAKMKHQIEVSQRAILVDSRQKHDELAARREAVDPMINRIITRLMFATDASRVGVVEYHNTITGDGGLPFRSMSMRYEDVDESKGIKRALRETQNLPMVYFSKLSRALRDEPCLVLDVRDKRQWEAYSNTVMSVIKDQGAVITVLAPMKKNGEVVGSVGLDYCVGYENDYNEKHIEALKQAALEVQRLIVVD